MRESVFFQKRNGEVLGEIVGRAQKTLLDGGQPIVFLDMDSTLFSVGTRTYRVILEWVGADQSSLFPKEREILSRLKLEDVQYSLEDTFGELGIQIENGRAALEDLRKFWKERFFSSRYLDEDKIYPGALEFVQTLFRAGVRIVYLTGRDYPRMGEGTEKQLRTRNFPFDHPQVELVMKPDQHGDDREFKTGVVRKYAKDNPVIASLENEPLHVVAIQKVIPDAMNVFVDTVCSDKEAEKGEDLYYINSFL